MSKDIGDYCKKERIVYDETTYSFGSDNVLFDSKQSDVCQAPYEEGHKEDSLDEKDGSENPISPKSPTLKNFLIKLLLFVFSIYAIFFMMVFGIRYKRAKDNEKKVEAALLHQKEVERRMQGRHLILHGSTEPKQYASENILSIKSPNVVPVIHDEAFKSCKKLTKVELDCKVVGLSAFKDCSELRTVMLKAHLYWIRKEAFSNCSRLESVLLSTTLTSIEDSIFHNSTNIREVSIPNNVKNYFMNQLSECTQIQTIYLLTPQHFKMPKSFKRVKFPLSECTLYVPDAQINLFRNSTEWSQFKEIVPLSQSKWYDEKGWWKKQ